MRNAKVTEERKQPGKMGRPPGSTSDATKQRILTAACECFGQKGYEATTNRDVGDRAGVTAAAIYQYFDSKQSLYVEAFRAAHAEVMPFLRAAVEGAANSRDALTALLRAYVAGWQRFPAASAFLSSIPSDVRRHPDITAALAAEPDTALTIVAEIIEQGVKTREIEGALSSAAQAMFFSITVGLSQHGALIGPAALSDAVEGFIALFEGRFFRESPRKKLTRTASPRVRRSNAR